MPDFGSASDGKSDDPGCTQDAYVDFLRTYLRGVGELGSPLSPDDLADAKVLAGANPCPTGNDASFGVWAYFAADKLKPVLVRYEALITKRFADRNVTDAQLVAAGTLDQATQDYFRALALVRPTGGGRAALAAYFQYLYTPALAVALRPVGFNAPVPDAINQVTREVTAFEDSWLGFIEASAPRMFESGGYAVWWNLVEKTFDNARTAAPYGALEHALLARLDTTAPDTAFEDDALAFQATITARVAKELGESSPGSAAPFADALAFRPRGGGELAYKQWATAFASRAPTFNASTPSEPRRALMKVLIDAKPCAAGAAVDELADRLKTGLAGAGAAPGGGTLAEVALPVACP